MENTTAVIDKKFNVCQPRRSSQHFATPLSMIRSGEKVRVSSISGKDDVRRFLSNLGFVEDAEVCVVSEIRGNVIVNVKGTRVAISKAMANRIMTA